jgi:hypothetical protein
MNEKRFKKCQYIYFLILWQIFIAKFSILTIVFRKSIFAKFYSWYYFKKDILLEENVETVVLVIVIIAGKFSTTKLLRFVWF